MTHDYCIVFDLDGVLLDSEKNLEWLEAAMKKTLSEFNLTSTKKNLRKLFPVNIFQFNKISRELGVEEEKLWKTRNKYYIQQKIYAMKSRMITPYSDVKELYRLKNLSNLCIISNSPNEVVDCFIEEFSYTDLFNNGLGRGSSLIDLKHLKPHPYLFKKLKKQIKGKHYLYIGDTENDRMFASNTKMKFLLLSRKKKVNDSYDTLDKIVHHLLKIIK